MTYKFHIIAKPAPPPEEKPNPKFQYGDNTNIMYNTTHQYADSSRADVYMDTNFEVDALYLKNLGAEGDCKIQVWEENESQIIAEKDKKLIKGELMTDVDVPIFTIPSDKYSAGDNLDIKLVAYYWDSAKWSWVETDSLPESWW